jgi:hypothetical protein
MNRMIRIGLGFLIVAGTTKLARDYFNEHLADSTLGLFYGLAIGAMLFGLRRVCRA